MAGMAAFVRILGVVTLAVAEWNSDRQRMNERPLVVNGIKQWVCARRTNSAGIARSSLIAVAETAAGRR